MSRISRLVVLVAALASLAGVMSATAGAVTWTNDGSTSFTATGGLGTLTSTGVALVVGSWDLSGTAPASATAFTYLVSGTMRLTGCLYAGTVCDADCGLTLTATTVVQSTVSGIVDETCGLYISGTKLCHIQGSTAATYTNEIGTLTVPTSNSLRITGANCPAGSNDLAHQTRLDFRVASASPPTITRAP